MRAYRPVVYTSFLLPDDDERAYADIIRENISLDILMDRARHDII